MENKYKQYFRKDQIKDFYFLSYFIFILSLIGETDVIEEEDNDVSIEGYEKNDSDKETAEINNCLKSNNEEKNDPIDQITNESKAATVNECVEKLVSPQVLAVNKFRGVINGKAGKHLPYPNFETTVIL